MFSVLSPAKKLDLTPLSSNQRDDLACTTPALTDDLKELLEITRELGPKDLAKLMKLSEPLAQLNYDRFQTFSFPFNHTNSKPAILAFNGDTYQGFEASTLPLDSLKAAQNQVGILSGLYGLLRPLDLIQPYRLEMGTRLKNKRGSNLYQFWGNRIADFVNDHIENTNAGTLINLASNEYFKALPLQVINVPIITPVFKEIRNGQPPKVISFCAKRARGMMARYIVQNNLTNPEELKGFNTTGYDFQESLSSDQEWIFTRELNQA